MIDSDDDQSKTKNPINLIDESDEDELIPKRVAGAVVGGDEWDDFDLEESQNQKTKKRKVKVDAKVTPVRVVHHCRPRVSDQSRIAD
jgi:hypothetical protein